jgi:hypothetical protein
VKTPTEWELELGYRIMDRDGWRRPGDPSWDEPITRRDFEQRAMMSTCLYTPWRHSE